MSHPDDMWVEITAMGDHAPRFLLATDGREVTISRAQAEYVHGRIDIEELEARIEAALRGRIIKPAVALRMMTNGHSFSESLGTVTL